MEPTLNDWQEEAQSKEISIEDLDKAVEEYLSAREDYEMKKKISNDADAIMKDKQRTLELLITDVGRDSWDSPKGKAIVCHKMQYNTPKGPEDKMQFAKYLESKYGKEYFWNMFGINHQTLNSFLKQELEQDPGLQFPGIGEPTALSYIQFRRKSK